MVWKEKVSIAFALSVLPVQISKFNLAGKIVTQ